MVYAATWSNRVGWATICCQVALLFLPTQEQGMGLGIGVSTGRQREEFTVLLITHHIYGISEMHQVRFGH